MHCLNRNRLVVAIAMIGLGAFTSARSEAQFTISEFTPIFNAPVTEPNLIGINPLRGSPNPSVLETLYGESNLRRIDDLKDTHFTHTRDWAHFKMVGRFTSLRGEFGIFPNNGTGDFVSLLPFGEGFGNGYTPDNPDSVHPETLEVVPGAFLSRQQSGQVFTLGTLNVDVRFDHSYYLASDYILETAGFLDSMVTFQIVDNVDHPANVIGNLIVGWEQTPLNIWTRQADFQDIVVEINGLRVVPEPTSVVLMALARLIFLQARQSRFVRAGAKKFR